MKWYWGTLIIICGIALAHLVFTLITLGTIWVVNTLFNFDMSSKFWAVYVGLLILSLITGSGSKSK